MSEVMKNPVVYFCCLELQCLISPCLKMEQPPGRVSNRLRSLLDRAIIERVWPEHVNVLDHSWKDEGKLVS